MSSYVEFLRELEKRVAERVGDLTDQVTAGSAVQTIEVYREKVGEIRAYRAMTDIIKDATDFVNQRTSKA